MQLLGVDSHSSVAVHMDVTKPLQGPAAFMQVCMIQRVQHTLVEESELVSDISCLLVRL